MKVNVEVHRSAESLDQSGRTGVCPGMGITGLVGQVRGNGAVDDTLQTFNPIVVGSTNSPGANLNIVAKRRQ